MSLIAKCDRCREIAELELQAAHLPKSTVPDHWEVIASCLVCPRCSIIVHYVLSGKNPQQINLNESVWIKRKGNIGRYTLWVLMKEFATQLDIGITPPFDENVIYLEEPKP